MSLLLPNMVAVMDDDDDDDDEDDCQIVAWRAEAHKVSLHILGCPGGALSSARQS